MKLNLLAEYLNDLQNFYMYMFLQRAFVYVYFFGPKHTYNITLMLHLRAKRY